MDIVTQTPHPASIPAADRSPSRRLAHPPSVADAIADTCYSRPRDLPGILGLMHVDRCADPDMDYKRDAFRAVVRTKEICADLHAAFHSYADLGVNRYPLFDEQRLIHIGNAYIAEHLTRVWMFRESARRAGVLDAAEPIAPYTDAEVDHV